MLWNLISRTGLIIVRTRCYSQFCPRELKLEYFSPHTVLPAMVSLQHCLLDGWCSWGACAPLLLCRGYADRQKCPWISSHHLCCEEEYPVTGGDNAVRKVQKKYVQESRNISLPTLGVSTVFWTFGQHGRNVCKVKTGMRVGFSLSFAR